MVRQLGNLFSTAACEIVIDLVASSPSSTQIDQKQKPFLQSVQIKEIEKAPLLSQRERQCLRCLLEGKTAKETANL